MKSIIAVLPLSSIFLFDSAQAFLLAPKHAARHSASLMMSRPDASKEIQEALRLSKELGADSKEARVAWDIVEEIDASDNMRSAFHFSSPHFEGISNDEKAYVSAVHNLSDMLSNVIEPAIDPIRTLITTLKHREIEDPKMSKLGGKLREVVANALSDAKAADDIYGPESLKASDAWNLVEQIVMDMNVAGELTSSSDVTKMKGEHLRYKESALMSHHDYEAVVDPQSLDDAMQALMKLEHLTRLVMIEKNRLSFGFRDDEDSKKMKP